MILAFKNRVRLFIFSIKKLGLCSFVVFFLGEMVNAIRWSVLLIAALMWLPLQARVWTSVDGKKTFEGRLLAYDKEKKLLHVQRAGKVLRFSSDQVSKRDQDWLELHSDEIEEKTSLYRQVVIRHNESKLLSELKSMRTLTGRDPVGPEVEYLLLFFARFT